MEFSAVATTLVTFLCLISLRALVSLLTSSKNKRRPPGPTNLPFFGSLFHLLGGAPHVVLRDLAKKHGPVIFLRTGQIDTVVVSSPEMAQEVLQKKDTCFASRPTMLLSEIILYGNLDIAMAPYGPYWRMLRKLCTMEILSTKMVRRVAPIRNNETLATVRKIQAASQRKEPVNMGKLLSNCTNSIAAKSVFGQACSEELQEQFLSAIAAALGHSGQFSFADVFPSLSFLDVITGTRRGLWQARRQLDVVFDKIIAHSEAQRGDDLVSVLLTLRDTGELEFPIGIVNIKAILADMFGAGTETTSATAEWVMTDLMRNPDVMAKAQAEVRRVFDHKSAEEHEGLLDELHYTKMVIKEAMRMNPVSPLLIPHICRETCDVGGFEVQEGTRVLVNAWAMARNPEYWHDADKFIPERFEDGKIDFKASRYEYLPFGAGRRRCPGDTFALAVLELIVSRLLYYFDWTLPDGMQREDIDMDVTLGLSMRKKIPLHVLATPYTVIP